MTLGKSLDSLVLASSFEENKVRTYYHLPHRTVARNNGENAELSPSTVSAL